MSLSSKNNQAVTTHSHANTSSTRFAELAACLGDPPLLPGEDREAYAALSAQLDEAVKPRDAIEFLWLRDVTDLTWEILRLRRLRTSYLRVCASEGLAQLLTRLSYGFNERQELTAEWAQRKPEAIEKVKEIFKSCDLPQDAIQAETFAKKIDEIEKIDRLISTAESRRLVIFREVDRHRETLGRMMRDAVEVKDADFRVVEGDVT